MFETVSLLSNTIKSPHQVQVTKTKFPCTGFAFYALQNKTILLDLYKNRKTEHQAYYNFILRLIQRAGKRKENNKLIPQDGEFITSDTVKKDFIKSYRQMQFNEINLVDEKTSKIIAINELFMILFQLSVNSAIIITRSYETFLMIKLDNDTLFIIDSHKTVHGTVNLPDGVKYITRDSLANGVIQYGIMN